MRRIAVKPLTGGVLARRATAPPCQGGRPAARTGDYVRSGSPMAAILEFVFFIIGGILQLLIYAIIINAILSWLVAFDVINLRNRFVYNIARALEAVTAPVMRPVQRFIPPLGGVDVSPIIVILVLIGMKDILLPALYRALVTPVI